MRMRTNLHVKARLMKRPGSNVSGADLAASWLVCLKIGVVDPLLCRRRKVGRKFVISDLGCWLRPHVVMHRVKSSTISRLISSEI